MLYKDAVYTDTDLSAIKILEGFLPDKIFDAHTHLFDSKHLPNIFADCREQVIGDATAYKNAMYPMLCSPKTLRLNIIPFPDKAMADKSSGSISLCDEFIASQLNAFPDNVGEIMVRPNESAEEIEKRLTHSGIRGLKCYHTLADAAVTWNLAPQEYLPESAWEVASKYKMYITLHMVKDKALSDPENSDYICRMATKYPDVVLILAHAARSFAAWTAIEGISKVSCLPNVWFDFSGICESPAMIKIIQKVGVDRCMWGSDYPICTEHGKAISVSDTFYWIYEKNFKNAAGPDRFRLIGIENLMAVREACILASLPPSEVEKLFYDTAASLFDKK